MMYFKSCTECSFKPKNSRSSKNKCGSCFVYQGTEIHHKSMQYLGDLKTNGGFPAACLHLLLPVVTELSFYDSLGKKFCGRSEIENFSVRTFWGQLINRLAAWGEILRPLLLLLYMIGTRNNTTVCGGDGANFLGQLGKILDWAIKWDMSLHEIKNHRLNQTPEGLTVAEHGTF